MSNCDITKKKEYVTDKALNSDNILENGFYLNIVHRPEMIPEYLEKSIGFGKEEGRFFWCR